MGSMKRHIGASFAILALLGVLTGCAADEPERTFDDYFAVCLDVIGPQMDDAQMTIDYCTESINNALADLGSETSTKLFESFDAYLDLQND